ncbi:MAG: hypothetical protein ACPGZP_08760 [Panacagrimonas sp.]
MSFLLNIETATPSNANARKRPARSNILGVTGMSRRALADMFRHHGLFGRQSHLNQDQQAVVQAQIGPIPGLRRRPQVLTQAPALQALAAFTRALVSRNGEYEAIDQSALRSAGLRRQQISEVITTVQSVRDVFGLPLSAQVPANDEIAAARVRAA